MDPRTWLLAAALLPSASPADDSPETRALAFLSREVPRWSAENGCFSCHNNGDAARALFAGFRSGHPVEPAAMTDTLAWLARPSGWDDNGGNPGSSDVVLARIQFASALDSAIEAGLIEDETRLTVAAEMLVSEQGEDGSFPLDDSASLGSPATYGRALATATARNVLEAAGREAFTESVARADTWLRELEVKTVIDAASVLLGLGHFDDAAARAQRDRCLDVIRRGHAPSGGWGPYVVSPAEPFDTALVLLALAAAPEIDETAEWLAKGRRFLLEAQLDDGSWPETTRPAGQQSYAQYISTTGWAALALLRTSR